MMRRQDATNPRFLKSYVNLRKMIIDHAFAALGDAYANFTYSLALSRRNRKLSGAKLKGLCLQKQVEDPVSGSICLLE